MYRLFFIAKNNIKKQRGEMITFVVLTFFATLFIFISLSMLTGSGKIPDDVYDRINGEDVELYFNDSDAGKEAVSRMFTENENIGDFEYERSLSVYADYKNKKDSEYESMEFSVGSYEDERSIQKISIDTSAFSGKDIVLPYYLKGSFKTGDTLSIKIDDEVYEYSVAGFMEDSMYSNPLNMSIYRIYLSSDAYAEMENIDSEYVSKYLKFKGKLSDKAVAEGVESDAVESELSEAFRSWVSSYETENTEFTKPQFMLLNWSVMKDGDILMPFIALAIVFIFAVIIIVVSLIIISFNIKNFIQRNMTNTGIMEASGYTVKEIRRALLVQIIIVTLVGANLGIAAGCLLMQPVGNLLGSLAGLSWHQSPEILMMLLTAGGVLLVFILATLLIGRKYKKISTLDALRGGMTAHNYKKNRFGFEKTNLPTSIVLSLKETFGRLGNSITIMIIAAVLAAVAMLGFGLVDEFGGDARKMMDFTGMELGEVITSTTPDYIDKLKAIDGVEHVVGSYRVEFSMINGSKRETINTIAYQDTAELQHSNVVEGRMPIHENEIALTPNVTKALNASVGDSIEVNQGNKTEKFIITGKYQLMQNGGKTATMTVEGMKRLNSVGSMKMEMMVYISDGLSFETMQERIKSVYPEINLLDGIKIGEQSMGAISSSMTVICILICTVTLLIVIFIETLLIKSKIVREWKNFGVSKALGFTTQNLMIQTAMSNIPALIIGSLVGILVSGFFGSVVTKALLSMFGFEKVSLDIPVIYAFMVFAGMLIVAAASSMLISARIRKLNPVEMITEE
ncbi:MAG: ABC transporter permease [Eubacterium sp.]|nr:ABC transporter permease [Eubacterium sp.]